MLGLQGSGWGWLVSKGGAKGRLEIVTTKDQDPVNDKRFMRAPAGDDGFAQSGSTSDVIRRCTGGSQVHLDFIATKAPL
jgi:superoxide dismutase